MTNQEKKKIIEDKLRGQDILRVYDVRHVNDSPLPYCLLQFRRSARITEVQAMLDKIKEELGEGFIQDFAYVPTNKK